MDAVARSVPTVGGFVGRRATVSRLKRMKKPHCRTVIEVRGQNSSVVSTLLPPNKQKNVINAANSCRREATHIEYAVGI